jgi:hypothetical protein
MSRSTWVGGRRVVRLVVAFVAMVTGVVVVPAPAGAAATAGDSPSLAAVVTYKIINDVSRRCMEVEGASTSEGARIQQWGCGGDHHRQWVVTETVDGVRYHNRHSGMCLTAVWGTVNVTQLACSEFDGRQRWHWRTANVAGARVLVNVTPFGDSCLALRPFSFVDGRVIGIADCATTSAQLWHNEPVG